MQRSTCGHPNVEASLDLLSLSMDLMGIASVVGMIVVSSVLVKITIVRTNSMDFLGVVWRREYKRDGDFGVVAVVELGSDIGDVAAAAEAYMAVIILVIVVGWLMLRVQLVDGWVARLI
ncbi:MAG: hypothetical protein J3R72DRAFT_511780 [Linnemannia gamsii]|nr:MAG: hypothetical protein J3R72DRAFT_511780 [Linnemannia gamsii]